MCIHPLAKKKKVCNVNFYDYNRFLNIEFFNQSVIDT